MNAANLTDLQAFAAVARLSSFRKAALELGVTPSALSHTMRSLEGRLGVRLLNRTTRSVSTTEAGQQLLDRLAPALSDIASALDTVNDYRESPMGTLRINAPRSAVQWVLPRLISQFQKEHPGMQVEVMSDDSFVDIAAEGFDAGIRFGESLQQDMVAIPIGQPQAFKVVASPEYLVQHGKPRHPKDLHNHPCARVRFPSGAYYHWQFSKRQHALSVDVLGPLTTNDTHLMVQFALSGQGFTYAYTEHVQHLIETEQLASVLDDWMPPAEHFYLYYPSRRHLSAGLKAFIRTVQAR